MSLEEMRALVRDHHKREDAALHIQAIIQDSSDLAANKVRVYRLDIRRNVVVNGIKFMPGLYCWLKERPDKELAIDSIDVAASTLVYGEAVGALSIPPGAQETVAWSIPGNGFTPGRVVASTLGGLYLHVQAFQHDGGLWPEGYTDGAGNFDATYYDIDVSASVPGTTGYVRWLGVYLDGSAASLTTALHTSEGALVFGTIDNLDEADLNDLALPSGCYPLGAVALYYGQTEITATSRFADWRWHIGKKEIALGDVVVDRHGDVVTDRHGTVVYSR